MRMLVLQNGTKGGVRIGNKLGTATVGGKTQPIYLNKGLPAICDTVANMVASAITEAIAGTAADDKALKEALTKVVTKVFTDSATGTDATSKALQSSVEKIVAAAVKAAIDGTATNDKALHDAISNMVADIFKEAAAKPSTDIAKTLNDAITDAVAGVFDKVATATDTDATAKKLKNAISGVVSGIFTNAAEAGTSDTTAQALRAAITAVFSKALGDVINAGANATDDQKDLQTQLTNLIATTVQQDQKLASILKATLGIPIVLTEDMVLYVDGTNGKDAPKFSDIVGTAAQVTKGTALITSADIPNGYTATSSIPQEQFYAVGYGQSDKFAFKTIDGACNYAAKWFNVGSTTMTIRIAAGQYGVGTIAAPSRTTGSFVIEPYNTTKTTASTLDSSNNVITRLENKIYDGSKCTTTTFEDVRIAYVTHNSRTLGFTASNEATTLRHIAVVVVYAPPVSLGRKYPYCVAVSYGAKVTFATCEFWALSGLILRRTAPALTAADTEAWVDTRGITVSGNAIFQASCSFIGAYVDLFGLANMTDTYHTTTAGAAARKFFRGEFPTKAAFTGALPSDPVYGDLVKIVNDESIGGGENYYFYSSKGQWTSGDGQPESRTHAAFRVDSGAQVHFGDSNTQNSPNYYFYGSIWGDLLWTEDSRIRFDGGSTYSPRIVSACPTALIKSTKTTDGTAPTNPAGNVLHVQNGDKYTTYTFVDWYTRDMRTTEGGYEYRPLTPLSVTGLSWRHFDRKVTVNAANAADTFDINIDAAGTITVTNTTQGGTYTTHVGRCRTSRSIREADGSNFRAVHLPMPNDPKLKKIELVEDSNSTFQGSRPTVYKDYEEVKYGVETEKRSSSTFNDVTVDSVRLS